MKKRIVSLITCGVLAAGAVAGFAGCGDGGAIKLTVMGPAAQTATIEQMAEEFKAANPDKKYEIKVTVGEEDMAYSNVSKDPSAAADVYFYSNDQLVPLLRVGALARIGGTYLETVKAENSEESVASGSIAYGTADEKVYGYPYSDNGSFLFYDKSVVTDEQAASLDTLLAACETEGKKIAWALDVPWYVAGWFFAFGGEYGVEYDYENNYKEENITINFDDEEVGIKASKAMAQLADNKAVFSGKNTKDETIITGFSTHTLGAAVSGTWNAVKIKELLGDNYGVCKLPEVTVEGETVQLSSFKGYKLLGVNPHSENIAEAHRLAQFLTGEAMQQERFEKHLTVPTNKAVAESSAVKSDETYLALKEQNRYAKDQTSVPSSFWEPLKDYGLNIIDGILADEADEAKDILSYGERLTTLVERIKSSITN